MLEVQDLSKQYNKSKKVLDHISMTLTDGVYGLLGPNGAGKSTLMNIITGNLFPEEGKILWDGQEIQKLGTTYREVLGYAPQQQGLYDAFTGRRFLSYMSALKGIAKTEVKGEIDRVASYVNLESVLNKSIGTYSGGMKQRLLVAQAMLGNPRLIILDEPTAGLDPRERVRLREKIAEAAKDKILLIATHVVSDVESIAKEIIILKEGNIIAKDTVAALCETHQAEDLEALYMKFFEEEEKCEAFLGE